MALNKSISFRKRNLLDEKNFNWNCSIRLEIGVNNKEGKLSQSEINKIINFCIKKNLSFRYITKLYMLKIR